MSHYHLHNDQPKRYGDDIEHGGFEQNSTPFHLEETFDCAWDNAKCLLRQEGS